ncbi:oligosaccharide flippase family protein [Paenibacillus urinalis]|uniref:Oligosaccharide flippase family protein n=1 Tax=Paenibacillus urinalis TaxID=521520 RepID=A0ABY7XCM0_9BACL|nr:MULTISPECIES: oligosaccharide flippase family protein [Terrabacteria group]WDH99814.1 oligosaccharide flippase family protein [Paenibacillus urinalis]WDI03444.1 oligosaccharide flippase family protein [Paenibacillus urinalis]SGI72792.1 membrane protein involved in the export of O-antigen and teichoic acid [Mycobacterium tuberculosis]
MLVKHSIIYLFSRGVPSLINFCSILIYTRMLSPDSYGTYALVIALMNIFNIVFFQWLRSSVLRFMPNNKDENKNNEIFNQTILFGFSFSLLISGIFLLIISNFMKDFNFLIMILALINIWILAWYEINQTVFRANLEPIRYGIITLIKVSLSLLISVALIYFGLGVVGLLIGIFLGTLFSIIGATKSVWKINKNFRIDKSLLTKFLRYGLPLTLTFSMAFLIQFSDRFIISALIGTPEAGYYSVASDFSNQTIAMLMMIVNLGAMPIAIRKLELEGVEAARQQLAQNLILMLVIAMPVVIGGILLSDSIAYLLFSGEYAVSVSMLIPYLLIATLIQGLKAYYFDQSFQLGNKTTIQIVPVLVGALTSIILNFILIPMHGIIGAAFSSIISYTLSLLITYFLGKNIFKLPIPIRDSIGIIISALIMAIVIMPFRHNDKLITLLFVIVLGAMVYFLSLYLLNVYSIRNKLKIILKNKRTESKQIT